MFGVLLGNWRAVTTFWIAVLLRLQRQIAVCIEIIWLTNSRRIVVLRIRIGSAQQRSRVQSTNAAIADTTDFTHVQSTDSAVAQITEVSQLKSTQMESGRVEQVKIVPCRLKIAYANN